MTSNELQDKARRSLVLHALAHYPKDFKGCVVSPTKICLQFLDPQVKLRVNSEGRSFLPKLPDTQRYLPIPEQGTDVALTAVGCQLPVVEKYQLALIDAYLQYAQQHSSVYRETYGKEFKDFLLLLLDRLKAVIAQI